MRDPSFPWRGVQPARQTRGLSTLYTRRQLEVVLHRERARADRNSFEFALILFRARAEERRLTLRLARLLVRRARTIDEVGWFDDSCLAVLLPYTGAEGAHSFAENVLKLAQSELIPSICRIYTYPNAWYFDDDGSGGGSGKNGTRRSEELTRESTLVRGGSNGNGHNGNGHSHANANGHNGNGHAHANGNGHSNGNGHANGNGHSNGNGHANGNGKSHPEAIHESDRPHLPANRVKLKTHDLMPFFLQGMAEGLRPPETGTEDVETLLVNRLPWWKRVIDFTGAAIGLLALSPIMILAALSIKGTSRGPVFFKQRRAGLGGKPFWIYKFRTMSVDAESQKAALRKFSEQDGPAFKLTDDPRITPVGRFLRETSLDELPQLWNVLKGDMSLVGPRPLPMDESAACHQWQRRRLDVTPGLTCIWQVKGRSRVTFAEWMRMDVNYITRRTLWHDVKILGQTIPAVLMRKGAR